MNIAEKLIKLRKEKKLTQSQLAKDLNVALISIKKYENINTPRIPEARVLYKISKYFDVSMDYLIDDRILVKKNENLLISKDLGLSESSIKELKNDDNKKVMKEINFLLSRDDFYYCLEDYKILKTLKILYEYTKFDLNLKMDFLEDKRIFYIKYDTEKSLKNMYYETTYLRFKKRDINDIDFETDCIYLEIELDEIIEYIKEYEKRLIVLQKYINKLDEKIPMEFDKTFKGIKKAYDFINNTNIPKKDSEKKNVILYEQSNVLYDELTVEDNNSITLYEYIINLLCDYDEFIGNGIRRNINYYFFNIKEQMEFIFKSKLDDEDEYKKIINELKKN